MANNCAYMSLTDAVLRGEEFNYFSIHNVISNSYKPEEADIVQSIYSHQWDQAKEKANALLCSQFNSKPKADLSKLNRAFTRKTLYHPNRATMYQQLKSVCDTKMIGEEQAHKICELLSSAPQWSVSFKSMIFLDVYKLWYSCYTNGKTSVDVYCSALPTIHKHWVHHPTIETPAY